MVLHYSISFENGFPHHGEVDYPLNVYQNFEPYVNSMTAFVKPALTKSLKKWGHTPELLNNTKVNDEYLFRNLARKMEKRTKNSCKTKTLCNAH